MIQWTKEFETGSATLDRQHRLLIDNINLLEELLHITNPTKQESEFLFQLVDYLEAYANLHFRAEEKCSVHAVNQHAHERFREYIHNYKRLCEIEGFKVELVRNLHELMRAWIQEHILKIDTQLRPCIGFRSKS